MLDRAEPHDRVLDAGLPLRSLARPASAGWRGCHRLMAQAPMSVRDGTDRHEALCDMDSVPHDHCDCGLPMAPGGDRCTLCDLDGLDPKVHRAGGRASDLKWDGKSYPSWRRRRLAVPNPDGLIALVTAILRPPVEASRG
jgi:hypothetical protein